MPVIEIECPQSVLISLKKNPAEFGKDLRLAAAMKFYELGRLSSGRAAELAGISRVEFLEKAGEYGVPVFDLSAKELAEDVLNA